MIIVNRPKKCMLKKKVMNCTEKVLTLLRLLKKDVLRYLENVINL